MFCTQASNRAFLLPPRSPDWTSIGPAPPPLDFSGLAISPYVTDAVIVTIPWATPERLPPTVTKSNRDQLTEEYRRKAENRVIPKTLEQLQQMVCFLFYYILIHLIM